MSDTLLAEYRAARKAQLVRNEARHILTKISVARGSRHDAGVRWPFELLQNAIDAGPRAGRESIHVSLYQERDRFVFEHDGAYFRASELAALLSGGSSKEFDSEDTTGRFGTGFLVTHVLAPRTLVSGILETEARLEHFALTLDRDGDEDSIVANIDACEAALASAARLDIVDAVPSARFEYVADDVALALGIARFRASVPYLFGTCARLGRVSLERETWESGEASIRRVGGVIVHERVVTRRVIDRSDEYVTVRVTTDEAPDASAIVVLLRQGNQLHVETPGPEFSRVFCRYPIRSSGFLPINVVLDAPFHLDQERREILFDEENEKALFKSAVCAAARLVRLAFDEGWAGRHSLARAAPSLSSFTGGAEETEWLTGEMRAFAEELVGLRLVETRKGYGAATDEWSADFPDPEPDQITMARLWPLVDDVAALDPPLFELAEAWAEIAKGWIDLGVELNVITLATLVSFSRGDREEIPAEALENLRVRSDKHEWLARFLDAVGESWTRRGSRTVELLDGLLPNQHGKLTPLVDLHRDNGISESLKDIAERLGCPVRSRLLDGEVKASAERLRLQRVDGVLSAAVPGLLTEDDVISECVSALEKRFPKAEQLDDVNKPFVIASIELLTFLASRGEVAAAWARRIPLLAHDGTFARTAQMLAPVGIWDSRAREFQGVYPLGRILASNYSDQRLVDALVQWGLAFPDPLIRTAPSDAIKDARLNSLVVQAEDLKGVHLQGEKLSQVALLHELIPRCQTRDVAVQLLGLVLRYIAPADNGWRESRSVIGRRDGVDLPLTIRPALWLADLLSRNWVPVGSEEGKTSLGIATADTLKTLLDAAWLEGNDAAVDLLGAHFGFDRLELRLLGADTAVRDQLARIVELAGADPARYATLVEDLVARQRQARAVDLCRNFGLAVQAAIQQALERQQLEIEVIDRGFDFEVADELDDPVVKLQSGSLLIEVKATTQGDAKLTPLQAETASQQSARYVLCVVDLRGITPERLEQPWSAEDVLPLARMVSGIGAHVKKAWDLVEEARSTEVEIRNERALRYAVPPEVWENGRPIAEWVTATFNRATDDLRSPAADSAEVASVQASNEDS